MIIDWETFVQRLISKYFFFLLHVDINDRLVELYNRNIDMAIQNKKKIKRI